MTASIQLDYRKKPLQMVGCRMLAYQAITTSHLKPNQAPECRCSDMLNQPRHTRLMVQRWLHLGWLGTAI